MNPTLRVNNVLQKSLHPAQHSAFVMSSPPDSKRAKRMISIPDYIAAALGLSECQVPEDELEGRMLLARIAKRSDVFHAPLLMGLVEDARDVLNGLVLPQLDGHDLAMLARVSTKMREFVEAEGFEVATKKEKLRVPRFVRSVELLRWACQNGCPWDARICRAAAEGGHLETLQWARANDCPWDYETCAMAAKGGRLEVLQWARANGCPWDDLTRYYATDEILEWAVVNGVPEYSATSLQFYL